MLPKSQSQCAEIRKESNDAVDTSNDLNEHISINCIITLNLRDEKSECDEKRNENESAFQARYL